MKYFIIILSAIIMHQLIYIRHNKSAEKYYIIITNGTGAFIFQPDD